MGEPARAWVDAVGVAGGALTLTVRWVDARDVQSAWYAFWFSVAVIGVAGVISAGLQPQPAKGRADAFVVNLLVVGLAAVGLASAIDQEQDVVRIGWLLTVSGAGLVIFALAMWHGRGLGRRSDAKDTEGNR